MSMDTTDDLQQAEDFLGRARCEGHQPCPIATTWATSTPTTPGPARAARCEYAPRPVTRVKVAGMPPPIRHRPTDPADWGPTPFTDATITTPEGEMHLGPGTMRAVPIEPPSPYDLTLMALAEVAPAAHAALASVGPTRAGDPPLGSLGWMPEPERLALAKAAIIAHTARGTEGFCWTDPTELADTIHDTGSWRQDMTYERCTEVLDAAIAFGRLTSNLRTTWRRTAVLVVTLRTSSASANGQTVALLRSSGSSKGSCGVIGR